MKQLDDVQHSLLLEVHALIANSAARAVAKIGARQPFVALPVNTARGPTGSRERLEGSISAMRAALVSYPPNDGRAPPLSRDEHEALAELQASPATRTALEKLIADAASEVIFGLLCLIDGVGAPSIAPISGWAGAELGARRSDEDREMLHDAFFHAYWRYLELARNHPR